MRKLMLVIGLFMCLSTIVNAQNVAGKYGNSQTTWEFIETDIAQEYKYKSYNKTGELIGVGFALYSIEQQRFVIGFKRTDAIDSIGYAVCKLEGNTINVTTLNPDGSKRWSGTLTKK